MIYYFRVDTFCYIFNIIPMCVSSEFLYKHFKNILYLSSASYRYTSLEPNDNI